MEYLQSICTPEDFLYRHREARGDLPIVTNISRIGWDNFTRALTHYLVGNVQQALEGLRAMDAEVDRRKDELWYFGRYLKQFLHEAEQSPERECALLNEGVNENAEKLGLQKAREFSLNVA